MMLGLGPISIELKVYSLKLILCGLAVLLSGMAGVCSSAVLWLLLSFILSASLFLSSADIGCRPSCAASFKLELSFRQFTVLGLRSPAAWHLASYFWFWTALTRPKLANWRTSGSATLLSCKLGASLTAWSDWSRRCADGVAEVISAVNSNFI